MKTRVALIQFNPRLGELESNITRLTALVEDALQGGARIVVTPELSTTGYSLTEQAVQTSLGLEPPFVQLEPIRAAAMQFKSYVFVGIAERIPNQRPRNAVVGFQPGGEVVVQHKRGVSEWHASGELPIEVIPTPFGDIAAIICSDTFLPDWPRVAALRGADIVVSPANWWGSGQVSLWRTRSRENGVWTLVANRWGVERDDRYAAPCQPSTCGVNCENGKTYFSYLMDDSPSTVIDPRGGAHVYRAMDEPAPRDRVIFDAIEVDACNVQSTRNESYSIVHRWAPAYAEFSAGPYAQPPGLPEPAPFALQSFAAAPKCTDACAIESLKQSLGESLMIPRALAIAPLTQQSIDPSDSAWAEQEPWKGLAALCAEAGVGVLAMEVSLRNGREVRRGLVVIQKDAPPALVEAIHGPRHSGPYLVDLAGARVAVVTGEDALIPETAILLARAGADAVLVSSTATWKKDDSLGVWSPDDVFESWLAIANSGLSVAAGDQSGHALVLVSEGGWPSSLFAMTPNSSVRLLSKTLTPNRTRHLNRYLPSDLEALLSGGAPPELVAPR